MAKPVILAVDDDPQVLRPVERDLRRKPSCEYRVLRADSGQSALDTLGKLKLRGDADNGPGIPREIQGCVFELFFATKQVGEGTGLGLDIVRRIVVAHGGEVAFDSKPGETRFVVPLPIERRNSEEG